jgi:hypothetical protein
MLCWPTSPAWPLSFELLLYLVSAAPGTAPFERSHGDCDEAILTASYAKGCCVAVGTACTAGCHVWKLRDGVIPDFEAKILGGC